jgi:hypothetical protein
MIMKPPELGPQLMLTPFDTEAFGHEPPPNAKEITKKHLEQKFEGKPHTFFPRAMYAIYTIVKYLKNEGVIKEGGSVWVTSTTDSQYVSSCVNSAIEQTVPMTRELTEHTGAIFMIHEFGFPHPKMKELRAIANDRGIPLIEDCAYGWGTVGAGKTGDYVIYSLTKAFPLQFGGYLVGKHFSHEELWKGYGCSDAGKEAYTEERLASWIPLQEESTAKRRENYRYYQELFGEERTFWALGEAEPGAYVLKMRSEEWMKEASAFVRGFGIECGNYWHNSAIMLPVHQRMTRSHLDYVAGAVFATEREWCGVPGKHP